MAVKKQRLDKYYNLAKEKGYRARSAFKLLELDKKYGFIKSARVAVDLCAAPGGWMQVLAQEMPVNRKIIGVDLDPIKPLGGDCVSFIGDITTIECRRTLVELLDGHQADLFVHDGAPNFGASKEKDHFVQNDLVLSALKLATEFLKEGGAFITKIFRSENFSKIVQVLERLFNRVDVTKPLSSRSESAEIFAVCRGFKSSDYIDPSLFDSGVLFVDRGDDDTDKYKKILLSEFIRMESNRVLDSCVTLIPDFSCELLTPDILEMLRDLKLVHPSEMRRICAKKRQILSGVRSGRLDIPILSDLKMQTRADSAEEDSESSPVDKLKELEARLGKIQKKSRGAADGQAADERAADKSVPHEFFDDGIFGDFESTEADEIGAVEDGAAERVEVSSCSDSLEMTESEMRCLVYLKEAGRDKFEEATVDRYMVDEDDIALPFEKRPNKMDAPRMSKKKLEVLGRKKARALRRAEKVVSDIVVEDEEDEAVIYKKAFKNAFKQERKNLRLVFASRGRGGRFTKPRGKGKILCLDRRMKHDLRLQKRRERARR